MTWMMGHIPERPEEINIAAYAFYNGRERGICLDVRLKDGIFRP
jgi:hypothetical protein